MRPTSLDIPSSAGLASLRRFAAPPVREACALCDTPLNEEHDHLVDPQSRRILCSCIACALLFPGREDTRFKRVPRDVFTAPRALDNARWRALGVPVELVFFFLSTAQADPAVVAIYPSPAGPTETGVNPDDWRMLAADVPAVGAMQPDTQGLLIDTTPGRAIALIAPIDECYRLVGLLRTQWRGISGGPVAHEAAHAHIDALAARAREGLPRG